MVDVLYMSVIFFVTYAPPLFQHFFSHTGACTLYGNNPKKFKNWVYQTYEVLFVPVLAAFYNLFHPHNTCGFGEDDF